MISDAHTISNHRAVMIEPIDAYITLVAVPTSFCSDEFAFRAELSRVCCMVYQFLLNCYTIKLIESFAFRTPGLLSIINNTNAICIIKGTLEYMMLAITASL